MIHLLRVALIPIGVIAFGLLSWLVCHIRASRRLANQPILVHKLTPQEYASIIAHIEKDEPRLANPNLGDWERVNLLRQWACEHVLWGSDSVQYHTFFNMNCAEFLSLFEDNRGAVKCEGAAYFLMRLYKLYGYRASLLDLSIPGAITHAVVIVEINYKGRPLSVIQGSYYNASYTDNNANPYDYREIISLLEKHKDPLIRVNEYPREYYFLAKPEDNLSALYGVTIDQQKTPIHLPSGWMKYPAHETLADFDKVAINIHEALQKLGYPPKLIYLFACNPKIREDYLQEP